MRKSIEALSAPVLPPPVIDEVVIKVTKIVQEAENDEVEIEAVDESIIAKDDVNESAIEKDLGATANEQQQVI